MSTLGSLQETLEPMTNLKKRCVLEVGDLKERYTELMGRGFHGTHFQTLEQIWLSEAGNEVLARVAVPEHSDRYHMHPAMMDGVFQLAGPLLAGNDNEAFPRYGISLTN